MFGFLRWFWWGSGGGQPINTVHVVNGTWAVPSHTGTWTHAPARTGTWTAPTS